MLLPTFASGDYLQYLYSISCHSRENQPWLIVSRFLFIFFFIRWSPHWVNPIPAFSLQDLEDRKAAEVEDTTENEISDTEEDDLTDSQQTNKLSELYSTTIPSVDSAMESWDGSGMDAGYGSQGKLWINTCSWWKSSVATHCRTRLKELLRLMKPNKCKLFWFLFQSAVAAMKRFEHVIQFLHSSCRYIQPPGSWYRPPPTWMA